MFRQRLLPAALFIMPAAAVLTTEATLVEAASEECMAKPGSSASTSSRWYYRVDRVNHRRCWFLSTRDLSAHSRMRRASSLRRRHLISRSTGETDIAQQSELDEQTVAGPTPRQGPILLRIGSPPVRPSAGDAASISELSRSGPGKSKARKRASMLPLCSAPPEPNSQTPP